MTHEKYLNKTILLLIIQVRSKCQQVNNNAWLGKATRSFWIQFGRRRETIGGAVENKIDLPQKIDKISPLRCKIFFFSFFWPNSKKWIKYFTQKYFTLKTEPKSNPFGLFLLFFSKKKLNLLIFHQYLWIIVSSRIKV